jgi:spermidine/putrescine transport system permease protein
MTARARLTPYWLILPAWVWLALLFVVPLVFMLSVSLMTGNLIGGFTLTWHVQTYTSALGQYHTQLLRSLLYGAAATAITLAVSFPVAYFIAFRGGRHKSSILFLLLLPFFVSFVIRTQQWSFLLADNGLLIQPLKDIGVLPGNFHVLATPWAVIGGLAYNSVPFMVMPIYVALERIDGRLIEAATDLFATRRQAVARVVLPLSLPGVFAGCLLTFVPAASDYVNASILGGPGTTMIGNIIQTEYFTNSDYPTAAALSFVLMIVLLAGVLLYARMLGTDDVLQGATL